MVAYSFKERFVDPIASDRKLQTIRAERKRRHARPGEELQLYAGMRTRSCMLIARRICESVQPVRIYVLLNLVELPEAEPTIRGWELDVFAQQDGFEDWPDMRAFWQKEHPDVPVFSGVVIRWHRFK